MAPPHHNNLQDLSPPLSTHRRCSKAQMCFFNILRIISVYPKPHQTKQQLLLDLNTESELLLSPLEEEEKVQVQEHSEISHVGDHSSSEILEEENTPTTDEGYLGLLFEAAQLILGAHSEQEDNNNNNNNNNKLKPPAKRKKQCWTAAAEAEWYAEFEDTSPVVKSKRGRNQVLPFKYRDSVVEPLVRWTFTTATRRSK